MEKLVPVPALEIPDSVVERLRKASTRSTDRFYPDDPSPEFNLGEAVLNLINIYADMPKQLTVRHELAVRAIETQSLEQSIATAKPGEDSYSITNRAERLTDFKLGTC